MKAESEVLDAVKARLKPIKDFLDGFGGEAAKVWASYEGSKNAIELSKVLD